MAQTRPLIDDLGTVLAFGTEVVACLALREGVAFALADGRVAFGDATPLTVHGDGAILCAAARGGIAVLSGGDDGLLLETRPDGTILERLDSGGKWIDQIAVSDASGFIAAGAGKTLWIVNPDNGRRHSVLHANTVQGLCFDPRGKRVAAARYNGVSLWWTSDAQARPTELDWKGSHIGLTWSPDGRFIVSAMQDNALHGWRLADKTDMQMPGYPAKTRSFAWVDRGRWLATSGSEAVVCWPFQSKDGPMGKPPLQIPLPARTLVTQVAAHPRQPVLAAGFDDGGVMLYRLNDEAQLLLAPPSGSPVTALGYAADGLTLAFGRVDGSAGLIHLPE